MSSNVAVGERTGPGLGPAVARLLKGPSSRVDLISISQLRLREAQVVTQSDTINDSRPSVIARILANPLVGLSPWILYSIVEGKGRLELSAALALGLGVVILSVNWLRGGTPKILEYSDVAYFAGLAIVIAFASVGTRAWLELWGGEVANIALLVIVLGSILIRMPFTLQYARADTPQEYWHTPEFLRVNYLITWVWALAFGIEALSGLVGDAVLHNGAPRG